MLFQNISNFHSVNDYLPILVGCVLADVIIIFMLMHNIIIKSNYLKKWYKIYNVSACIADILILVIGIIIARFTYKYIFDKFCIWKFTALAIIIQIIHDIIFYLYFKFMPIGYSSILDFFKKYAREVGIGAILGDSFMMILACLFSSYFAGLNVNTNIILLIILVYILPYLIYM